MSKIFETRYEPDCVLFLNEEVIYVGCYSHLDGKRNGEIISYPEELFVDTTGTLDLKLSDNKLFAANVSDISIYNADLSLHHSIETTSLNTYIEPDNNIIVSCDINGSLNIYDLSHGNKQSYNLSDNILWVCRKNDNYIYCGGESGTLFIKDIRTSENRNINIENNITFVDIIGNQIYVCSYGNTLKIYDQRNYKLIKNIELDSGIWRIKRTDNHFFVSSMYDGFKIFDTKWNLLNSFKTDSICYGIEVYDKKVAFTSFYDKKVFVLNFNELNL
ncbi:hypothetical protein CWI39_0693p0010 [Hamiltosporidium magnivora]|uniref:Uncharacterized protein n=1 Tax=Hamiltosporidium magnivora TaxID=148818 RepID=A0A4Q9LEN3_9MICR|nr:hypothetical protein CWI39_0693p0010 [Hamiltosporidium magnivora]